MRAARGLWIGLLVPLGLLLGARAHLQASPSPREASFYQPLTALLRAVHRPNGVCYSLLKLQLDESGSPALQALERLKAPLPKGLSHAQELAYWINAYNTLMIVRVAELWPIESVKGALKGEPYALFKERSHIIAGAKRTLDEIEHQLIRPRFKDPRVHAALNCASASCPPLSAHPFLPERLEEQLQQATRSFILDTKRQDLHSRPLALSMIFKWYADDFKAVGGVRQWMAHYAKDPAQQALLRSDTPHQYLDYDWSINAAPLVDCAPNAQDKNTKRRP